MQPVRITKKPKKKKKKKTKNPNSGKVGIRPDHPHHRIEIQFCMVGALRLVVLNFKFDQNQISSYRDVRGQNLGSCITLANGLYSPVLPYRRENMIQS